MFDDPYTLYIAPNNDNYAEGMLYVDDGHSFNFTRGEYAIRKFIYDGKTLRNKIENSYSQFNCSISLIKIGGIIKRPISITCNNNKMEFEYRDNTITIIRANLPLNEEWIVYIE